MKKRVLLVEDHAASREMMLDWLTLEGYEAQAASDLDSARAALLQGVPDAVLLDVGLGAQNGLDLPAWMRQRAELAGVPIIAVTAFAMVTDRDFIFTAGCDDSIPKPVDFSQLRSRLARWLRALKEAF